MSADPKRAAALDRLKAILEAAERAGHEDMGHLTVAQAGRFHRYTLNLRTLVEEVCK